MPNQENNIFQVFEELIDKWRNTTWVFILYIVFLISSITFGVIVPIVQYFDKENYLIKNTPQWVTIIAIILFATLIIIAVIYYSKNKLRLKIKEKESRVILRTIMDLLKEISAEGDINKLSFIQSRLEKERMLAKSLMEGDLFLPAINTYDYLRKIYHRIIEDIKKQDLYVTISDLNFWSADHYGSDAFIKANLSAIVKRGAVINRVTVIEDKVINSPYDFLDEFGRLKELLEKLMIFEEEINKYKILNSYSDIQYCNLFYITKNLKKNFMNWLRKMQTSQPIIYRLQL